MLSQRLTWTLGALLTVGMTVRLIGRIPVDEDDRALALLVAEVQHEVRAQYVDEISPAKLKQMQQAAIGGMLSTLDPHTVYVPPAAKEQFNTLLNGTFVGIGVQLMPTATNEIAVESPIDGGPAFKAGLEAGDVFVKIDGKDVRGLDIPSLRQRVVGEPGTRVALTVRRYDGTQREITVERQSVNLPTVTGFQRNADASWDWFADHEARIAYLRIGQFNEETGQRVRDALQDIVRQGGKGVIVDVRFNGGGRLEEATTIANYFLREGTIVSVKGRVRPETVTVAVPDAALFDGPMAILVNGDSASASEILSGALADHLRAAVIGTRTYGKGSVQEVEDWGGEGLLKITVARWFPPSGKNVNREPGATTWGVEPTIAVPLTDQEEADLQDAFNKPMPIPPKSHATTRPARVADRQLETAVRALKTQLYLTPTSRP